MILHLIKGRDLYKALPTYLARPRWWGRTTGHMARLAGNHMCGSRDAPSLVSAGSAGLSTDKPIIIVQSVCLWALSYRPGKWLFHFLLWNVSIHCAAKHLDYVRPYLNETVSSSGNEC